MTRPVVRYARTSDGLEIAYQVLGDGPLDVVIVPGMISNLDRNADYPFYGCYLRRFPRFARTIVLDKRGGGVSDREVGSGSPEDRLDDGGTALNRSSNTGRPPIFAPAPGVQ